LLWLGELQLPNELKHSLITAEVNKKHTAITPALIREVSVSIGHTTDIKEAVRESLHVSRTNDEKNGRLKASPTENPSQDSIGEMAGKC
jgi:hypothetical protein